MSPPLLASDFSSADSLPLSAFIELKGIQDLLWIRLQLKRILWLVWSSILTTETVSISPRMQASFLIICIFTGVALLISFKNFPFAFTTWLIVSCNRPSLWPISAFNINSFLIKLLLLSYFSRVRLCATPWTAAHQAPPSMGFSRQEYWSGVPLPSPCKTWEDN